MFFSLFMGFVLHAQSAMAEDMTAIAIYNRCYTHITGSQPDPISPRYQQVLNNTVTPIDACVAVLNLGSLTANSGTTLANTNDVEAKTVLKNMHRLHASWFQARDFVPVDPDRGSSLEGTQDLFDVSMPALYITRSLFGNAYRYESIARGTDILIPMRTDQTPSNGAKTNRTKAAYVMSTPFNFAPKGELIGITTKTPEMVSHPEVNYVPAATVPLFGTFGGGLIGNFAYIGLTVQQGLTFKSDGGVLMPRKWGRAVYHDLICRDLPVVRTSDGDPFVNVASPVGFRKASGCVSCHASMDRAASVIRGVKYHVFGANYAVENLGLQLINVTAVDQPAEVAWPTAADTNYNRRPTNGTLYFRNYRGELINQNVTSADDLGTRISNQDDFYACAAKRYYRYFTGISVDLNDIGDSRHPGLTTSDLAHRNLVIQLGQGLKTHGSLKTLIKDIMSLPHYQKTDFGLNPQ